MGSPSSVAWTPMTTIRVDPAFAEALVWRSLQGLAGHGREEPLARHHERAAAVYALTDGAARERAFERMAMDELAELRLMAPLAEALAERPALAAAAETALVVEAPAEAAEGVTCDPATRRLGVTVLERRFDEPAALRRWARHALGHAEDTLDLSFGFVPGREMAGGRARVAVRLHALWDVSVDGRSARLDDPAGGSASSASSAHRRAIAALWPEHAGRAPGIVKRLWHGPRPTFADLRRWAEDPASVPGLAASPAAIPDLGASPAAVVRQVVEGVGVCPLCRFPSAALAAPAAAIAALARAEYPAWRAEDGLCERCTDRYLFARLGGVA